MRIRTGCDLVHIPRFEQAITRSGKAFLDQLFTPHELARTQSVVCLAGLFASKEATIKALELPAGRWHAIEICKKESGRPYCSLAQEYVPHKVISSDLSISHDGEYAMAVAQWIYEC